MLRHIALATGIATAAYFAPIGAESHSTGGASEFVSAGPDGQFHVGDSVYRFIGTNFWYGPILASEGAGGDSLRLHRELDRLNSLGITNLRILAGAEGSDGLPHHIRPVLQTSPGIYNDTMLVALDRFIAELERRSMKAVIYLTNAWEWSGGYGSYLYWSGHGQAPVPGIDGYREYVDHVKAFVLDDKARQMAINHAKFMAGRINSITGQPYADSPAIMAWQIANEPRAFSDRGKEALLTWIRDMAQAIKSVDPNHLVSTGSEGKYGCESDIELWRRIHALPEIDYSVIHLWPTNWGWASRDSVEQHVERACILSDRYIDEHIAASSGNGKPIVIEEFGYPRDGFRFDTQASTSARDTYYRHIIDRFHNTPQIAGLNFWGWNGEARPEHKMWQPGDPYCCDPAHEPQGMYGVFDSDITTISLLPNAKP